MTKQLMNGKALGAWGVALLCCALGGASASAALLYDGFDYASGNLAGNAGGVGWAPGNTLGDGAWDVSVDPALTGSGTVETGSLTLSTFPTVGNRLRLTVTASTDFSVAHFVRPFRNIDVNVSSGELWQSFLWRRVDNTDFDYSQAPLDGLQSETRNNGFGFSGPIHFRVRPKRQNLDGSSVRYDGQVSGPPAEVANPAINNGETFLYIVRFTNLGTTDKSGKATMWVLNAADYDAIQAGGNLGINRTLFAEAASTSTAPQVMSAGHTEVIFSSYQDLSAFNSLPFIVDWDELRWGTTVGDVVPGWTIDQVVPEPGTCILAGIGSLLLGAFGRRKR